MTATTPRGSPEPAADVPRSETMPDLRPRDSDLDLLGQFPESPEEDSPIPGRRGLVVTSAGVLAGIVLESLGFVSGTLWGTAHEPDLGYQNLAAELAIKIAYAVLCGVAVAAAVVALCCVVAGVLWMRHRALGAAGARPSGRHTTARKPRRVRRPRRTH